MPIILKFAKVLVYLCVSGVAVVFSVNGVQAQSNTAMSSALQPSGTSEGAMEGVSLDRSNYYPGTSIQQTRSVIWKSPKYFVINYDVASELDVDQTFVDNVDKGFSDPVMANGMLYFRLTQSPRQHCLFAVDQTMGFSVWRFESKVPLSAPAVAGDTIYVESADGTFYALEAGTGREKWRYTAKGEQWAVGASPAILNGVAYVSGVTGNLYALEILTRKPKWVFKSKGKLTSPTFADGAVFVGCEKGYVYAVDQKSGDELWNVKVKSRPDSPVLMNGSIYLRTQDGVLWALDAKSGQQLWTDKVGGKIQPVTRITSVKTGTLLAAHNKSIFFAGTEEDADFLYAIDGANGQMKWKFATNGPCRAPVVTDDTVYIGCVGKLYGIDAQSGKSKWAMDAKNQTGGQEVKLVPSSPAVSNGRLYYLTDEGFVYAVQ